MVKELDDIMAQNKLDFYFSTEDIVTAINCVLNLNPIQMQTLTKIRKEAISAIAFDNLVVVYQSKEDSINVFKVIWSKHFIETNTQHTKEWLDSISNVLNFEELLDHPH